MNISKCSFAHSKAKLLGQIVNAAGVKVDRNKIRDISEAFAPKKGN